jgi:hypothetical protein
MKQGIGARIRERLGLRWPLRRRRLDDGPDGQERQVIDDMAAEFTHEELQEFLEADLYPIEADPAFREELRDRLWELVQRQHAARGKAPGDV